MALSYDSDMTVWRSLKANESKNSKIRVGFYFRKRFFDRLGLI